MATELMNTSAPKGLAPGSSGFCTVAVTAGMPGPMVTQLESLSGYTVLFSFGSAHVDKNPPSNAHWIVEVGGGYYSVLSHVCFAGADHSGRPNKFAHHVVVEPDEQIGAGPAWIMSQKGAMETQWKGEPHVIPGHRRLPVGKNPPRACSLWKTAAGDAGWAGVLAETFLLDATKPAYVLFRPGMKVLPLLDEALALLPERLRWKVTFNTYFTHLPPGQSCTWRCCVAGTPAALEAPAKATSGVIIDLTKPPRALERNSKYISLARSGTADNQPEVIASVTEVVWSDAPAIDERAGLAAAPPQKPRPVDVDASALDGLSVAAAFSVGQDTLDEQVGRHKKVAPIFWIVAVFWPLFVLGGGTIFYLARGPKSPLDVNALQERVARLTRESETGRTLIKELEEDVKMKDEALQSARAEIDRLTRQFAPPSETSSVLEKSRDGGGRGKGLPDRQPTTDLVTSGEEEPPPVSTSGPNHDTAEAPKRQASYEGFAQPKPDAPKTPAPPFGLKVAELPEFPVDAEAPSEKTELSEMVYDDSCELKLVFPDPAVERGGDPLKRITMQTVGGSLRASIRSSVTETDVVLLSAFLSERKLWWKWEPAGMNAVTDTVSTALRKRLPYATIKVDRAGADPLGTIQFVKFQQLEIAFGKDLPLKDFDLPDSKNIAIDLVVRTTTGFKVQKSSAVAELRLETDSPPRESLGFSIALTGKENKQKKIRWTSRPVPVPFDLAKIDTEIIKAERSKKRLEDFINEARKKSQDKIAKEKESMKPALERKLEELQQAQRGLERVFERLGSEDALSFDIVVKGSGAVLVQVKVTAP